MTNKMNFYRSELGLPLQALAQLTGLSRWILRAIELGYKAPSPQEKESIAKFLGETSQTVFPAKDVS